MPEDVVILDLLREDYLQASNSMPADHTRSHCVDS